MYKVRYFGGTTNAHKPFEFIRSIYEIFKMKLFNLTKIADTNNRDENKRFDCSEANSNNKLQNSVTSNV